MTQSEGLHRVSEETWQRSLREHRHRLLACSHCDLLHARSEPTGGKALCSRCGTILGRFPQNSIERTLAFALASAILFVFANVLPFMTFELHGRAQPSVILRGVMELYQGGMAPLACLVCFTVFVAPLLKILLLLYVSLPLRVGWTPPKLALCFRWYEGTREWGMLEVYMLAALIAMVELTQMGNIVIGVAFYSYVCLMITTTAASASLDPEVIWERLEAKRV